MNDPVGDFLPSFVGPENGDLDVVRVGARRIGPSAVELAGDLAADLGTTPGAAYVWGIDRGSGTPLLGEVDPPIGTEVTFDAVAAVFADGSGFVLDIVAGTPPTFLGADAVSVAGDRISVTLSEALLPSTGFLFSDYRYNLWPRFAPDGVDPSNNLQVSDLAPDNSTFVSSVPLPASLGLVVAGIAALGGFGRLRHRRR